jgi:hypothetical protein
MSIENEKGKLIKDTKNEEVIEPEIDWKAFGKVFSKCPNDGGVNLSNFVHYTINNNPYGSTPPTMMKVNNGFSVSKEKK